MLSLRESQPNTSIEKIEEFERDYELELPGEYKKFLLLNNGGTPDKVYYIENNADLVVNFFLSLGSKKFSLEEYIEDWHEDKFPREFVPIGEDAFGNIICISCIGENKGQIYFFDHETTKIRFIAPSFQHLLENLRADLE